MANRKLHFFIDIPAHEYQAYYAGAARNVAVVTREGLHIKFPANILRPFVTYTGIRGEFTIEFDQNNKLVALRQGVE